MSTPISHLRNLKGNGYDPGQNSWFEFSIVDFIFKIQHLNFTAEFKNLYSSFRIHIIGKRFYACRLAFELNFLFDLFRCTFSTRQTNFYTLLLFISFDTWTSTLHLTEIRTLHSKLTWRILPVTALYFKFVCNLSVIIVSFRYKRVWEQSLFEQRNLHWQNQCIQLQLPTWIFWQSMWNWLVWC